MKSMGTTFGTLLLIETWGKTLGIAVKTRRALAERNAMGIGQGDEAIGIAVEEHLAEAIMIFTAVTRNINENGTAETNGLQRKLFPGVVLFIEFGGILRNILNAGIRHRAYDIETVRPKPFKDTGGIARLALVEASKVRHPFGSGQINAEEDKVIMRSVCTFSVFTASEITHLERRKTVIARNVAQTLDEILDIGLFKVFWAMLIVVGKRHEGANGVLEGFKAHPRDPIRAAFLKTRRTFTARNEH